MSGIAGICNFDEQPVDRRELERMAEILAHRGPDGEGVWYDKHVGFVHRMLRTTPEMSDEVLPRADETTSLAITSDARIDNRDDLISKLGLASNNNHTITDSELILRAYEKWGNSFVEQLVGDFALAIWDGRRRQMLCARDHFGVKPFYYWRSGSVFVFASEIKALLCAAAVPRQLNELRLAEYLLSWEYVGPLFADNQRTLYRDIYRLSPGHCLIVNDKGMRIWRHWRLDPGRELRLHSQAEYAEAMREHFFEAVRCRLRRSVRVGSCLSGGLDSSSITCVTRDMLSAENERPLDTFSVVFDEIRESDERPFIRVIEQSGGLRPHHFVADQVGLLSELDRLLWHQDEAFYDPNVFMQWWLYRLVREKGVCVLMDGEGGDSVVSNGIEHLIKLALTGRWLTFRAELKALDRTFGSFKIPAWRLLARHLLHYGLKPRIPGLVRRLTHVVPQRKRSLWKINPTVHPNFAARRDLEEAIRTMQRERAGLPKNAREKHYKSMTWGHIPFNCETNDRCAAAFALEPRYPFYDKRLAEFCLAVPSDTKLHQGTTRMIMRQAMADLVPEKVRWRCTKTNYTPMLVHCALTYDRELLDETVLHDAEAIRAIEPYIDIKKLGDTYERFLTHGSSTEGLTVWKAATLAIWLGRTKLTA